MREEYVRALIGALALHPGVPSFDLKHQPFSELLTQTDPHDSSRFYIEFSKDPKWILNLSDTKNISVKLSLRRLLRTNNVREGYTQNPLKLLKGAIVSYWDIFDSTSLTRELRRDPDTNEELRLNHWDYALLGKLETKINVDGFTTREVTKAVPLFIIPDARNPDGITRWEVNHTLYRAKPRLGLSKRITQEEYENEREMVAAALKLA